MPDFGQFARRPSPGYRPKPLISLMPPLARCLLSLGAEGELEMTDIWYDLALRELSGRDDISAERVKEAQAAQASAPDEKPRESAAESR